MKKILVTLALMAFVAAIFSSCKGHERCPAYGKVDKGQTEKNV